MMTPSMKRFLLGTTTLIILTATAVKTSIWLLDHEAFCSEPCSDPGRVPEPDAKFPYERELKPTCSPVGLKLEVKANGDVRAKKPVWLFYRLTLTNRSCLTIKLQAKTWLRHDIEPWKVTALGKEGDKLEVPGLPKDVFLWDHEPNPNGLFRGRTGLVVDDQGFFELPPGKSIFPLGEILRPRKLGLASWKDADRSIDGWGFEAVASPTGVEAPPEGFMVLGFRSFPAPGHYQFKAAFDDHDVRTSVSRPYAHFVPEFWQRVLTNLELWTPQGQRGYHLHAETSVIDLAVGP